MEGKFINSCWVWVKYSSVTDIHMDRSPGSLFYEEIDAMTWADWEMDCEYLYQNSIQLRN